MNTKRIIEVDDFEHRVMMEALANRRKHLIEEKKPTEDISDVLLKVIDAPYKKKKAREREER